MTLDELKKHCKKNRYSDAQLSSFFDGYSKAEKDYQKGREETYSEVFDKIDEGVCDICEHRFNGCHKICNQAGYEMETFKKWLKEKTK